MKKHLFIFILVLIRFSLALSDDNDAWVNIMFSSSRSNLILFDIEDAYGVAFRDLNNDKQPDLYMVGFRSLNRVLINQGRWIRFEDETIRSGLGGDLMPRGLLNLELGTSVFDFDNDGDNDVLIAGWGLTSTLFQNQGDLNFTPFMKFSTTGEMDLNGAFVADVNQDGLLDLFLTDEHYTNRLFINHEQTFIEYTDESGLNYSGISQSAAFSDVDLDGDLDLYVANWSSPDLFYINLGNMRFRPIQLPMQVLQESVDTNSPSFADFDNDGDFDLFVTSKSGANFLYRNDFVLGDTLWCFTDISQSAGITHIAPSYSGVWADFNHDGWLDLFVTNVGANQLYVSNQDHTFKSIIIGHKKDKSYSTGATVADYDNDGDLDLFVANKDTFCLFYVNVMNDNHFIKLDIQGSLSNRDAIGTRVDFYQSGYLGEPAYRLGTREKGSGNGYLSMNDCVVHFALPDHQAVDVEIIFPSGHVIQRRHLKLGMAYTVHEVAKPYRSSLALVRMIRTMIQHPQFALRFLLSSCLLLIMIVFIQIGIRRYQWQSAIALGYFSTILLLTVILLIMLSPLGFTQMFIWLDAWTILFIGALLLYSERIFRLKRSRQQAHSALIEFLQEMIHIHQNRDLLGTVADHLLMSIEYSMCFIWAFDPDTNQINEAVWRGKLPSPELNNVTSFFADISKMDEPLIENVSTMANWPDDWPRRMQF